jgi:D-tyrosyl-tRNA(Tyr) deacylase
MRAVVQRVGRAAVRVDGEPVSEIADGLAVLVGVAPSDGDAEVVALARKLVELRIFSDDDGKMNRSVADIGGEVLVVSQFTLLGDTRKGRRPSFVGAAPPELAQPLLQRLVETIADAGVPCRSGQFGAHMEVELVNDGPVTLVLEVADGRVI